MLSQIQTVLHTYSTETVTSTKVAPSEETFSDALTAESSTPGSQVSAPNTGNVQFFGGWTAAAPSHAPVPTPFDPQPASAAAATANTPPVTPFVPEFNASVQVVSSMGGSWPLNPAYFATKETAQYIADKFGTGQVVEKPYGGTGGPYAATAEEYHIVLSNGATVNAGLLADYYVRMPEAQFPGLADTMIQAAVARAEQFNG